MATDLPLDDLSLVFARVRGLLLTEETAGNAVELLAQAAKTTIPSAIGAGVTVISSTGDRASAGSTDPVVREADALQYKTGEGPCLTAYASRKKVRVEDIHSDLRWPSWSQAVAALPVRSVVSVPLMHRDHVVGALKVYSATARTFTHETGRLLTLFAGPAAALLAHVQSKDLPVQLNETLQQAIGSRDTINISKGVLIAQQGLDEPSAMRHLIERARTQGVSMREVADEIVRSATARSGGTGE